MNIYDEAIERIEEIFQEYRCSIGIIENALERAKKEHELIKLYERLSLVRLFLFLERNADLGQELMNEDDEITKQIIELEEELK